jgi:hypothetical protein
MVASRWPQVVDVLVDMMRAQPGYRSPTAEASADSVLVLDGLEIDLTSDDGADVMLVIGGRSDTSATADIGIAGQSLATLGPGMTRDDNGEVVCQIIVQSGALELLDPEISVPRNTLRLMRSLAFSVLDTFDAALRAAPTLGIAAPRMIAHIGSRIEPQQFQSAQGPIVLVTFSVTYSTRT